MQRRHERGEVLTSILVGIIILLSTAIITAIIVALLDKQSYSNSRSESVSSAAMPHDAADEGRIRLNSLRKAEAGLLTDAVYGYYSTNKSEYPTGFSGGQLTGSGTPWPVKLTYFKQPLVATGTQPPLDTDTARVVTKAHCAPSGGATLAGKDRGYDYAVQYTAQNVDGTLEPKCNQP